MNPISEEGRVLWYDLIIHKKKANQMAQERKPQSCRTI